MGETTQLLMPPVVPGGPGQGPLFPSTARGLPPPGAGVSPSAGRLICSPRLFPLLTLLPGACACRGWIGVEGAEHRLALPLAAKRPCVLGPPVFSASLLSGPLPSPNLQILCVSPASFCILKRPLPAPLPTPHPPPPLCGMQVRRAKDQPVSLEGARPAGVGSSCLIAWPPSSCFLSESNGTSVPRI